MTGGVGVSYEYAHLLIVQGDVGPPEFFCVNANIGDIAVISRVPHQVIISPSLQQNRWWSHSVWPLWIANEEISINDKYDWWLLMIKYI